LVGRGGSIRLAVLAAFRFGCLVASLLGQADNGRWLIAPKDSPLGTRRRHRPGTFIGDMIS